MSDLGLQHMEARTTQSAAATVSPTSGNSNCQGSPHEPQNPD
ncbi:hypothetical protein ACIQZO_34335 [Streptomyces sp. NPDC097617]